MDWQNGEVIIDLCETHYVRCSTRFGPHWNYVWAGQFTWAHSWVLDVFSRDSDDDRIVFTDRSPPYPTQEQAQEALESEIDEKLEDLKLRFTPESHWEVLQRLLMAGRTIHSLTQIMKRSPSNRYVVKPVPRPIAPHPDRRSRTRAQWVEWGLIDIHPEYFPDWVYESLPAMGEFCEAEIQRGLDAITVQERSLEMQLSHPRLADDRRKAFTNIQVNQLTPQRSLLLEALHRARGQSWDKQVGICQVAKAILDIFDDGASVDEALSGLDTIQQLFVAHNYREGESTVERLRAALRQTANLDPVPAAAR